MNLVVPDLGELYLSKALLQGGTEATEDWKLCIYKQGLTPHREFTIADVVECDFAGYVRKDMPRANWTDPVLVNHMAVSYCGLGFFEWLSTSGSQNALGYYVTDPGYTVMLWIEKFEAPQLVTVNIPALVQPLMRLRSILQPLPP